MTRIPEKPVGFYRDLVIGALHELGSREEQESLWLSDGSDGGLVSSFVEAVERLADDSGLDWAVESGVTGMSDEFVTLYRELMGVLARIPYWDVDPIEIINDERMVRVRAICHSMLGLIAGEDAS